MLLIQFGFLKFKRQQSSLDYIIRIGFELYNPNRIFGNNIERLRTHMIEKIIVKSNEFCSLPKWFRLFKKNGFAYSQVKIPFYPYAC